MHLQQVQVCFRHGARLPFRHVHSVPRTLWYQEEVDSKKELALAKIEIIRKTGTGKTIVITEEELFKMDSKLHGPEGPVPLEGGAIPARLTGVGMRQAIELGRKLHARYVHSGFLSKQWVDARGHVYVRSTATERTVETVQGVLSGLYPHQITPENPAIVHIRAKGEPEWAAPNFGRWCPRLQQMMEQAIQVLSAPITDEAKTLLEELKEHVKLTIPKRAGAFSLSVYRDQLACREAHNKAPPKGVEKVENAMKRLEIEDKDQITRVFSGGELELRDEAVRLQAGRMMRRIVEDLENPTPEKKLILYSGHDWSIIMLLMCLDPEGDNPETRHWPGFCSDITIERWGNTSHPEREPCIRLMLNGKPLRLSHLDPTNKLDGFYTMSSFKQYIEKFLLQDHEITKSCQLVQ